MKKRYIAAMVGASAALGYLLVDKSSRDEMIEKAQILTGKTIDDSRPEEASILNSAGTPDQIENPDIALMENAKMVDEGSQYGVNYYNEVKDLQ